MESESGEKAAPSTGPSPCAGGVRFLEKRTSELCARVSTRGRADGEHVPAEHERRQRPAEGRREKGSRDSLFPFICLCVTDVGGACVGGISIV